VLISHRLLSELVREAQVGAALMWLELNRDARASGRNRLALDEAVGKDDALRMLHLHDFAGYVGPAGEANQQ
jgi:hypothetical protein